MPMVEICTETREDTSESCRRVHNRNMERLDAWYTDKRSDCRSWCTCRAARFWTWPCCVAQGICLAGLAVAYGAAVAALAVALAGCLAVAIIVTVVCYVSYLIGAVVLKIAELFILLTVWLLRIGSRFFCGISGSCCQPATASAEGFRYPAWDLDDDSTGRPERSESRMFADRVASPARLRLQYLGTNSIHISDGDVDVLIDPYFTRAEVPPVSLVLCGSKQMESNPEIIATVLQGAGITKADAIVLTHSHYDHILDVVNVAHYLAEQNDGVYPAIIGSASVAHVCRGGGIPETSLVLVDQAVPHQHSYSVGASGEFEVQLFPGRHIYLPIVRAFIGGAITQELEPPIDLFNLKEGGTFAICIRHEWGTFLSLGSAASVAGALNDVGPVDYLILGIAGLDNPHTRIWNYMQLRGRERFYRETVEAVSPTKVFFSHWDDFNNPLDRAYPEWYKSPVDSWNFFVLMNPGLVPAFLPIGGYVNLEELY